MNALLQLQWSMHKGMLLFTIIFAIVLSFFYDFATEISLLIFALIVSMNNIATSKRFLTENDGYLLIYSMPIARTTIIKSLYVFNFLFCTFVFVLLAPAQLYNGFVKQDFYLYTGALFGFYGACLLGTAFQLSFQLENLKKDQMFESTLSMVVGLMIVVIPHLAICWIDHEPSFWLRVLIMPISSVIVYFQLMQKSMKKFSLIEQL